MSVRTSLLKRAFRFMRCQELSRAFRPKLRLPSPRDRTRISRALSTRSKRSCFPPHLFILQIPAPGSPAPGLPEPARPNENTGAFTPQVEAQRLPAAPVHPADALAALPPAAREDA